MQQVYESKTQTGKRGLFTDGILVMELSPEESAAELAQKNGFELIQR